MAELATIARPYADALFEASRADLNGTAEWLDALSAVAADSRLQDYAANPKVSDEQIFQLVTSVLPSQLPDAGRNFLRAIIENDRLPALPEVATQYRTLKNSQSGSSDAIVHSAFPIGAQQLAELGGVLERRFGRKLNLTVQEDASLIGGIRVAVGDEVLDASVKGRLEQMKVALTA